ncbi:MAG: hypothetical protein IJU58_02205 [Clostridia bacterium]|nr:hypothetical protein [Clostridia bacterium]
MFSAKEKTKTKRLKGRYYILQYKGIADCYILEQKIVEYMLTKAYDFKELCEKAFVEKIAQHVGNDNKFYEQYELSKKGIKNYAKENIEQEGKKYIMALDYANSNKKIYTLLPEKQRIAILFRRYKINKVSKYDGKELKFDNVKNAIQTNTNELQENLELKLENKML